MNVREVESDREESVRRFTEKRIHTCKHRSIDKEIEI